MKTGGATLTGNQAVVYTQVQAGGSVAGRGKNADNIGFVPSEGDNLPPIPVIVLGSK